MRSSVPKRKEVAIFLESKGDRHTYHRRKKKRVSPYALYRVNICGQDLKEWDG